MANSSRRKFDQQGRMFLPMNVEGGQFENKFLDSKKMIALVSMLVGLLVIGLWISETPLTGGGVALVVIVTTVVYQFILRYVVIEERYFYRMYKKMQENKNPKSDIFWNIASIRESSRGSILMFADLKIGVMIKLDKDSIIGKDEQFEEAHFDAISDFYKEISLRQYEFVQLNLMEQAGKDPRIAKLDDLVVNCENKNVSKLIELQLGYLKSITRATLYETDYVLIYTKDINKMDQIIDDVEDIVYKILDGAFIGYEILNLNDVVDIHKEIYGVSYFDASEAAMNTFRNSNFKVKKAIQLLEITLENGMVIKLDEKAIYNINKLASCIQNGSIKDGEWTIREAIDGSIFRNKNENNNYNNNWGIDIDKLAKQAYGDTIEQDFELDNSNFSSLEDSISDNDDDKPIDF